jgi:putative glycosyltransferase (TIGR04372 family)
MIPSYKDYQKLVSRNDQLHQLAEKAYAEGLTKKSADYLRKASCHVDDFQALTPKIELVRHWVHMIGHICNLDNWCYAHDLGWVSPNRFPIILPPSSYAANQTLLGYFLDSGLFIQSNHYNDQLNIFRNPLSYIRFPNGRLLLFDEFRMELTKQWQEKNPRPLLKLKGQHLEAGHVYLKKLGLGEADWFVPLHVRQGGFHATGETRSAEITDYQSAIEKILERGGWVIRLGDASMPPLHHPSPQVIDYANSEDKCEELDIFLCAAGKFFLGTQSGLCNVAPLFGKQCLLTNWASFKVSSPYMGDYYIIRHYCREDGRLVSLRERAAEPFGHCQNSDVLSKRKIREVSNSAQEISMAVEDMLRMVVEGEAMDLRYLAYARKIKVLGNASLAPSFLKLNPEYSNEVQALG